MNETKKTVWFGVGAIVLALIALLVSPGKITPEAFLDQGEQFFPDFTDPNSATTMEVIEFDPASGSPRPFKVTFKNGRWSIPSHHDYPADGRTRLSGTAAGVIGIRKDDFRSDNLADHEACGVIDPTDETIPGNTGRGRRVTLKDASDRVLADFIVGNLVEGRDKLRFVRVPGQKRIYAVRMDIDLSTKFEDWIQTDLLQIEKSKIDDITILDYTIDERTRSLNQKDEIILSKKDDIWKTRRLRSDQQVDTTLMQGMLTQLDELKIVGVRPKPDGLSQNLVNDDASTQISQTDLRSLQSKGYYITRDGNLKSNEGELLVHTDEGVVYTLRFGEVLFGRGLAITAGSDNDAGAESGPPENRYLFVTAGFDATMYPEPPNTTNADFLAVADSLMTDAQRKQKDIFDKHEEWQRTINYGTAVAADLNNKFADWYYVISAESFDKLHLNRSGLVVKKESQS